jgi:steroid 5-alpha reductase family enzyme
MLRTIIFLIASLIGLPFFVFKDGLGLNSEQTNALYNMIKLVAVVAFLCFSLGELTRNYSQVDKIWSIIPAVYVWYFAYAANFNPRMTLMALMVTVWAARLTYNFSRRGGYSLIPWKGEEDYRWPILRKNPLFKNRISWGLFNLFFISTYQNGLIFLFTLPVLYAWKGETTSLGALDYIAAGLMLAFVAIEFIADQQQYDFQTEKYRRINAGEPLDGMYAQGFVSSGLWGMVRHPNYAAEQSVWLSFYLFSVAATGEWINWSIIGVILLILLFIGSSDFSEKISAGKYPAYAKYQSKVPRFIPYKGKVHFKEESEIKGEMA